MLTTRLHKPSENTTPKNAGGSAALIGFQPPAQFRPEKGSPDSVVQRRLIRGADRFENTINLADTILRYTDYGTTFVRLNNAEVPGGNFNNAVNAPMFRTRRVDENTYAAAVNDEPDNTVSARVALPTAPAWEGEASANNLDVRIRGTGQGFSLTEGFIGEKGGRNILLKIHGTMGDQQFANLVRQHEQHHVDDLQTAINDVLTPWDTAIHDAFQNNTEVNGADAEAAKQAMYVQLGGTPAQIGLAFRNRLQELGVAYHQQDAGGMPTINRVEEQTRFLIRDVVKVYYDHPLDA